MDFTEPCCEYVGGIIELIVNGVSYETTGDVVLRPWKFEKEAKATNSGKMSVMSTPRIPDADVNLQDNCGLTLADLEGCALDVVIRMPSVGQIHYFPRAAFVGNAESNLKEGEISGLTVASAGFKTRRI